MDKVQLREIVKGLLTHVPVLNGLLPKKGEGGGTRSAEYCYGVWMKHLSLLMANGAPNVPTRVAELGPGNSLGVGFAMLLSGASNYSAFDVVSHASDSDQAASLFDELHALFQQRAGRPTKGWPDFDHALDSALFPSAYLSSEHLASTLNAERVSRLRDAISSISNSNSNTVDDNPIRYVVPWSTAEVVQPASMDLVYSHSVLEYMENLDECYQSQWAWLRPGGYISHQIDLTGHSLSTHWDGFRGYSDTTWALMKGRRAFGLNRQPCSAHLQAIEKAGFDITTTLRREATPTTTPSARWAHLSEDDLQTSGLFVQARKPLAG